MPEPITKPVTDVKNAMDVSGKNVIVTGGGSGIGWGTSQAFAQRGANVAILDIDVKTGNEAAEKLKQYGGKYLSVECDISDINSVRKAVNVVCREFGNIDVLVNCAGTSCVKPFLDMDDQLSEWHRVIDVDLNGTVNMTYVVAKKMRDAAKGGLIINISSTGSKRCPGSKELPMAGYVSSKAALNQLTVTLAIELSDYNIRVNCIMPGPTSSKLDALLTPEYKEKIANTLLDRRYGEGIEIGALCVFFASPEGGHLDGVVMPHDGGFCCIN